MMRPTTASPPLTLRCPPGAPAGGTCPEENATRPLEKDAAPLIWLEVAVAVAPPLADWLPYVRTEQADSDRHSSTRTRQDAGFTPQV